MSVLISDRSIRDVLDLYVCVCVCLFVCIGGWGEREHTTWRDPPRLQRLLRRTSNRP